jgi:hypothetical protein
MIPDPDPLPLPAPDELLQVLLVAVWTLHILAVDLVAGGAILAAATGLLRLGPPDFRSRLLKPSARVLTVTTALLVTLGIPPLLIMQVLYGPFFFTSSILMAIPWALVIPIGIGGYLLLYGTDLLGERLGRWVDLARAAAAGCFALVMLLYVGNIVLMLAPEEWREVYRDYGHAVYLHVTEPTIFPRYAHFLLAAVAVAGLGVMSYGLLVRRREEAFGGWLLRYGGLWFLLPTLLQFAIGPVFLVTLPEEFLTGDLLETGVLWAGVGLALVGAALLGLGVLSPRFTAAGVAGIVAVGATIGLMSVTRHLLRTSYLSPVYDVGTLPQETQIGALVLFFVLAGVGVATVGAMIWLLTRPARPESEMGSREP